MATNNKKKGNIKAKPQNTGKKTQENEILEAISKINPLESVENVVKVPEEETENVKTDAETVISEANEILSNTESVESEIEIGKENLEETIEKEIEKAEKVIEKGKNILKEKSNNNYAFTDFWNGTTIY